MIAQNTTSGGNLARSRLLFVHNKLTTFVQLDRDVLAQRYALQELFITGRWGAPQRIWQDVWASDIVFCWFASAHSLLPACMGRLLGRPVVVVIGGYDTANMPEIGYGHQRGGIKKYVARAVMALATQLITNSQYTQAEAVREAGVSPEKITVVYHGVPSVDIRSAAPLDSTAPSPSADAEPDGTDLSPVILTVSNVDRPNLHRKGLEPFVRAALLLPAYRFVLVGEWLDDAIDILREIAPSNVTLTGRLSEDELNAYFARATVYVQVSTHEGFGLALAQAMLAGCAPVVTGAGALPEVVGDAGVYARSTQPGDVAAAITQAVMAHQDLGDRARQRIMERFSLQYRAVGLASVIDRAVSGVLDAGEANQDEMSIIGKQSQEVSMSKGGDGLLVSVIIPTRNEEKAIGACLRALFRQDYPAELLEIIVIDGRSTDNTVQQVRDLIAEAPCPLVILDNPAGIAPTALNIGIRAAHGSIIARVDGHTVVAQDYVRCCVAVMQQTGADNVGGLMNPQGRGYVGRCVALATGSRFGIGNSRFHYDQKAGAAETVYLGCFRRSIFERVGLFDESLVRNQDDELNDRIVAAGGKIWLDPSIQSTYYNRDSYRALWRQYYQYGYWKVRVLRRHPHARRLRHLAPTAAVVVLGGTLVSNALIAMLPGGLQPHRPLVWLVKMSMWAVWTLYLGAAIVAGVGVARRSGWRYLPGVLLAFWILHASYGTGYLAGLLETQPIDRQGHIPHLDPLPAIASRMVSHERN